MQQIFTFSNEEIAKIQDAVSRLARLLKQDAEVISHQGKGQVALAIADLQDALGTEQNQ